MRTIQGSIIINRPIAEVFAFVADRENEKLWRPSILDIKRVSGGVEGIGAVYKQGLKGPMGKRLDGDFKVSEYEPNKKLGFQVTVPPAFAHGINLFEAVPEGTKVTFVMEWEPKGTMKLMAPMIDKQMASESVDRLPKLKEVLEPR